MTPFLLSVHQASNSCLERPLCIIPGLAMMTHGPTSSNWSMFWSKRSVWLSCDHHVPIQISWPSCDYYVNVMQPSCDLCDYHVTIMWLLCDIPWDWRCAWRQKDLRWQFVCEFSHSWLQCTSDRRPCTSWRGRKHSRWEYHVAQDELPNTRLKEGEIQNSPRQPDNWQTLKSNVRTTRTVLYTLLLGYTHICRQTAR